MEKYIRAREITERYCICKATVYNWVNAGFLKPYKLTAGTVLYSVSEIEAFITSKLIA